MATGKITKKSIDALEPSSSSQFLWDTDLKGFGAKITPAGSISYVVQFRMGGREARTRRYTIGAHGSPWTPTTARVEAERLQLLVAQGIFALVQLSACSLRQGNAAKRFQEYIGKRLIGKTGSGRCPVHEQRIMSQTRSR